MPQTHELKLIRTLIMNAAMIVLILGMVIAFSAFSPPPGVIVTCPSCEFQGRFVWGNPPTPNWGSMNFTITCLKCKNEISFTHYDTGEVVIIE